MRMHRASALPRNAEHGQYVGGIVNWRVLLVHLAAKAAGLVISLEGFPLGSTRNLDMAKLPIFTEAEPERIP